MYTSSHTGMGIDKLMPTILKVYSEHGQRIPTGELNRFVATMMEKQPPPSKKGRQGRIYYITQVDVRPPRFLASVNNPDLIHFSYRRFLVNELRRAYDFRGVPLLIGYRSHKTDDRPRYQLEKGQNEIMSSRRKQATVAKRSRKNKKGMPGKKKATRKISIKRMHH